MLLDTIKMTLGGRAAEEVFLGEVSTGASSDLQQCNNIAKNMIKRYGLSKKFRNMVFGDENEEVFLGYSMGQVQSYSDKTAAEIDEEIKYIIDSCYEDTKRILIEKSSTVEGLAKRLIDKLTVDGPDFEKIYDAEGDLSAVYPSEYSGIDTSVNSIGADTSVSESTEPSSVDAVPVAPVTDTAVSTGDPDDSNDPGPSD
jgi:cell division protease FtsH